MESPTIDLAPIAGAQDDRLSFVPIANAIARMSREQGMSRSGVYGIDGPWGAGKSSLVNLTKIAMQKGDFVLGENGRYSNPMPPTHPPVVVDFAPWLVGNKVALISSFFERLVAAVDQLKIDGRLAKEDEKKLRRLKQSLKKKLGSLGGIVGGLTGAGLLLEPSGALAGLAVAGKAFQAIAQKLASDVRSLEETKHQITELFCQISATQPDFQIVVITDDLDRLEPAEALEVLRLIKAVADFPSVLYLLCFDSHILAKLVETGTQGADGYAYLEKIVSFHLKMPIPEPFQLRRWFESEIRKLDPRLDSSTLRYRALLDVWAGRLIHTPRDVVRITRSVNAMWFATNGELDLLDLAWIELLKEKASRADANLYGWVMEYLQTLDAIAIGGRQSGEPKVRAQLVNIMTGLGWRQMEDSGSAAMDYHHISEFLAGMQMRFLPKADEDSFDVFKTHLKDLESYRDGKRLSSPWHWRRYFTFEAPSHALTEAELQVLDNAATVGRVTLVDAICDLLAIDKQRVGIGDQIAARALHKLEAGTLKGKENWFSSFFDVGSVLNAHSVDIGFFDYKRSESIILEFVERYLAGLTIPNQQSAIGLAVASAREYWLATEFYFRDPRNNNSSSVYGVDDSAFDRNKKELASRFGAESFENLLGERNLLKTLFVWGGVTSVSGVQQALVNFTRKDEDLIRFLEASLAIRSSEQEGVPMLLEGEISKFLDLTLVKQRVTQLASESGDLAKRAATLNTRWRATSR